MNRKPTTTNLCWLQCQETLLKPAMGKCRHEDKVIAIKVTHVPSAKGSGKNFTFITISIWERLKLTSGANESKCLHLVSYCNLSQTSRRRIAQLPRI
ncbi:hypothetical protein M514_07677, partial [Trichuris suis]